MNKEPKILYKYRSFLPPVIRGLVESTIYFSSPRKFNDPMDCSPVIKIDTSINEAIEFLKRENINTEQINSTANSIGKKGNRDEVLSFLIGNELAEVTKNRYNVGIFSLSENYDCPLMWSHYGNQHEGICIGYEVNTGEFNFPHKVLYGESRSILLSELIRLRRDIDCIKDVIIDKFLLRKARKWEYEKEWRIFGGPDRSADSPPIKEIIFGMRCEDYVMRSVYRILGDKVNSIEFFKIIDVSDNFNLTRQRLNLKTRA